MVLEQGVNSNRDRNKR